MRIIATINEVSTRNWKVNAGEYKVKKCTVETPQEFAECDAIMVSFSSKENGKFVSWVKNGKCDIPCFANPGNVTVGVFAYTETEGKLELRYSPTPVVMPVNMGSYIEGEKPPTPTPGTYAELLEQIAGVKKDTAEALADLEKGTIKYLKDVNIWELSEGIYYLNGTCWLHSSRAWRIPLTIGVFVVIQKMGSGVRYIRLFNGTSIEWQGIECGYTDGTVYNSYYYNVLDTSSGYTKEDVDTLLETLKTELQGDIEDISALVGGAE